MRNGIVRGGPDSTYADGDDASWMDVDWPSLQRPVEVLGRSVNVLDTGGDGLPLVWIHGWSTNWQSWLLNIPYFMRDHRCIALDLPGFGRSEMPVEPISIEGYARTVDALCRGLGVDRVAVIGNSMGGFVGAQLALAFPTRVERLVLVSAAGLSIEHQPRQPLYTIARLIAAGRPYAERYEHTFASRRRLRRLVMQLVLRYPERLSPALAHELIISSGKPGFVPALDALLGHSFRDQLAGIDIPVLIVWGRNDMLVPVGDAARFERLIGANARAVIFDDTGHVPMIERPTRFNELVTGFLAGDPAPESEIAGIRT